MARATTTSKVASALNSTISLNYGVQMPLFGLGTYRITDHGTDKGLAAMVAALKHGYRMLDTASMYKNEEVVGQAIRESGVKREDLFLVTKVYSTEYGYDSTVKSCKDSLRSLGTDYIDLYLIHTSRGSKILETYDAMLDMQKQGIIRSVGVSNFGVTFLEELRKAGRPTPAVNQIEIHCCCTKISDPIVEYCNKHDIAVMGYAPIARGQPLDEALLKQIAEKYKKTSAQIMIRWSLQKGYITIPRSCNKERVLENADVFDFALSPEDEVELVRLPHWSLAESRGANFYDQEWEG